MGFEGLIRPLRRLRRVPPLVVDAGIALIFVVLVASEAVRQPVAGGRTALLAVLTLVMAACLALRRRWPLAAYVIGTAALVVESFLHVATEFTPLATLVGAYSVGLYASRARARWGLLIIVAGVVGYFAGTPGLQRTNPVQLAYVLLVWLGGWALRLRHGPAARGPGTGPASARAAGDRRGARTDVPRTARRRGTHRQPARRPGRGRADDLGPGPGQARELLKGMEDTGRETLADLDRVLATLRDDTEAWRGPGGTRPTGHPGWPSYPTSSDGSTTPVSTPD